MAVDRHNPIPFYLQVIDALRAQIREGVFPAASQLPGEHELCAMFNVSRTVIRQALNELGREGLILREKGRGTFVAQPKIKEKFFQKLTGFYQDMVDQGYQPVTQVLKQRVAPASTQIAEKLRLARYDFDANELKPYFELGKVVDAAFFTAGKLFGLTFIPREDIAGYHPDVRVWEVVREGKAIGLFYGDYFARPGKRSGAWMTSFRDQAKVDGEQLPLIVNTCNFMKPPEGEPALLSLDEARTVFHEMGHGLHGLLSNVTYPRISGTSVARDFVEFPSQVYEHWLEIDPVRERRTYYRTG